MHDWRAAQQLMTLNLQHYLSRAKIFLFSSISSCMVINISLSLAWAVKMLKITLQLLVQIARERVSQLTVDGAQKSRGWRSSPAKSPPISCGVSAETQHLIRRECACVYTLNEAIIILFMPKIEYRLVQWRFCA